MSKEENNNPYQVYLSVFVPLFIGLLSYLVYRYKNEQAVQRQIEADARVARELTEQDQVASQVRRDYGVARTLQEEEEFKHALIESAAEAERVAGEESQREAARTTAMLYNVQAGDIVDKQEEEMIRRAPKNFICPLTQGVMDTPVKASDGHIYELSFIERCFTDGVGITKSPLENVMITNKFTPQENLKNEILAWKIANGYYRCPVTNNPVFNPVFHRETGVCYDRSAVIQDASLRGQLETKQAMNLLISAYRSKAAAVALPE